MSDFNVAAIQQAMSLEAIDNLTHSIELIEKATQNNAHLIVLPELHTRPYFCQSANTAYFDWAEPIEGPTFQTLSAIAKKHNVLILASIFEKQSSRNYFNTAILIGNQGNLAGLYRKMHIPDDPGYYEKFYFTQGPSPSEKLEHYPTNGFEPIRLKNLTLGKGANQIDLPTLTLGVLVCWDQWYPEAARIMALKGADCLIYPTAIGWNPLDDEEEKKRQLDAWTLVQRGHAVANHLPIITANRIGFESDPTNQTSGSQFWGNSFITGPQGEFLARESANSTSICQANLSLKKTAELRKIWPFFRDRRLDAYSQQLENIR
jgi:N-carbamoylputrescine amidase